jgi:hypothetical protein
MFKLQTAMVPREETGRRGPLSHEKRRVSLGPRVVTAFNPPPLQLFCRRITRIAYRT